MCLAEDGIRDLVRSRGRGDGYKRQGTGPARNDLLGGQVDLLCDQTTQTVPMIKDGRVKVYGVTTLKRLDALPNVPTLDEQGLKGFEVKVWHGLYAVSFTHLTLPPRHLVEISGVAGPLKKKKSKTQQCHLS